MWAEEVSDKELKELERIAKGLTKIQAQVCNYSDTIRRMSTSYLSSISKEHKLTGAALESLMLVLSVIDIDIDKAKRLL